MRKFVETMLIAALGGAAFVYANFPAGWMAGALVFVAIAALIGRPMHVPALATRLFFFVLGVIVGGVATPETVRGMSTWPASIALISVGMLAITAASAMYLRLFHRWDVQTSMFASVPGALSQVSAMAAERNSDLRAIVIVQTLRVVMLAVGIPGGLALLGLAAPARLPEGAFSAFDAPWQFAILFGGSVVAALVLYAIKFSGGFFFGPMVVSAILHGSGLVQVNFPAVIGNIAMIGLGAINGARFFGTSFRVLLQYAVAALGSFAIALLVAAVFVTFAAFMFSLPVPDLVAAYAPGAVDVMMILALALHLDPVFVGAHHLARMLVVSLALPVMARLTDPPAAKPKSPPEPLPEPLETAREKLED
jgi:membrane AbrB-like protein